MIASKLSAFVFVGSLACGLVACGENKDDKSDTDETADDPTISGTGGGGSAKKATDFSIVGTWEGGNCEAAAAALTDEGEGEGGGGDEEHRKQTFVFGDDGKVDVTMSMFKETGCTTEMIHLSVQGDYTLGDVVAEEPPTRKLDFGIAAGTLTVVSQEMVDQLNGGGGSLRLDGGGEGGDDEGGGFCTKATPWVAGEAVDLADPGLTCGEDFPHVGMKMFDLASVVSDVLTMGDQNDDHRGNTEETRPVALSAKEVFKKNLTK